MYLQVFNQLNTVVVLCHIFVSVFSLQSEYSGTISRYDIAFLHLNFSFSMQATSRSSGFDVIIQFTEFSRCYSG